MAEVLRAVKSDHLNEVWYKSYFISLRHSTMHTSRTTRFCVYAYKTADYDVI